MLAAIPPAFVLALLLILLGTQLAYVIAPRAPHFLVRLGISAVAVLVGEVVGTVAFGQRLALGDLHPATDAAFLAVFQWLASRVSRREQAV
ncbi:MAG: hypothetical protein M3Z11_04810 [Candidatus Dormibacteraeota bacterium]|nr:hypothetical protein [Candidatus Dormibacteraeota bacterium]